MFWIIKLCRTYTLFALLAGGLLLAPAPSFAASSDEVFDEFSVIPITVAPVVIPGASARADTAEVLERLSKEATNQAMRTLVEHHFARNATLAADLNSARTPYVITGRVQLPISLPPNIVGFNAYHQKGTFATATAVIMRKDGSVVAREQVDLPWNAVWWVYSGKRPSYPPLDTLLDDFARRAADRSVRKAVATAGPLIQAAH